jgi:hypothetical protein
MGIWGVSKIESVSKHHLTAGNQEDHMKIAILNISKFGPTLTHFELPQVFALHLRTLYFISAQGDYLEACCKFFDRSGGRDTRVYSFRTCSDPQHNRQAHTLPAQTKPMHNTAEARNCLCSYVSSSKTLISTLWALFLARETLKPALPCKAGFRREYSRLIPISFNFSSVRTRSFGSVPSLSNYDPLCLNVFTITWLDFVSDTITPWNLCRNRTRILVSACNSRGILTQEVTLGAECLMQ